jgi:hypothetical protein
LWSIPADKNRNGSEACDLAQIVAISNVSLLAEVVTPLRGRFFGFIFLVCAVITFSHTALLDLSADSD